MGPSTVGKVEVICGADTLKDQSDRYRHSAAFRVELCDIH